MPKSKPEITPTRPLFKHSPVPIGLTIFSVENPQSLPFVRRVVTFQALAAGSGLGIPMPKVDKVISLFPGTPRALDQAVAIEQAFSASKQSLAHHELRAVGTHAGFDWTSDEGLCVLQPLIESAPGWVTLEWHMEGELTPAMAEGLIRMASAAKAACTRIGLFVVSTENAGLPRLCQEYLAIRDCEPGPGHALAFVVDCWAAKNLGLAGLHPKMISVFKSDDGLMCRTENFVSDKLKHRFMAMTHAAGETMESIGAAIGLNKSTVSRALQDLPKLESKKMSAKTRALWLDAIGHSAEAAKTQPPD